LPTEFLELTGAEELIELADDVGEAGLAGDLVDGEDVVGEALRVAGRPAHDAAGRVDVLGAHPVGDGAGVG
jgi:hypothetical protein